MQPTGNLHLGNYLGAIRNWVKLEKDNKCIFCIVDLHAITVPENRYNLKKNILEVTAAYIASGINPKETIIFNQSTVSGHSELAWILGCHTPIGWLNRMTQFKDKAGKNKEKAPLGLYSYPVLMAADILLYKSTHVPVGEDQKQHLELARNISQSFNRYFKSDFFPLPEPLILGQAKRVMSLKDGGKKMSKSDPSEFSRINLKDTPDEITKKIQKARTDSLPFPTDLESLDQRPEVKNLINIFLSLSDYSESKIFDLYGNKNFSSFKTDLVELINCELSKISVEMKKLLDDKKYLITVLKDGSEKADKISKENIFKVKDIMGLI